MLLMNHLINLSYYKRHLSNILKHTLGLQNSPYKNN